MSEFADIIGGDAQHFCEMLPNETLNCQICTTPLQKLSLEQRQAHYDGHFSDREEQQAAASFSFPKHLPNADETRLSPHPKTIVRQNIFWFPTQTAPPPPNFTPGLIQILRYALLKTHAKGLTTRAMLCHEGVTHVAVEFWDIGWGCGYRNFLMACTALIDQSIQPLYFPLLDEPISPGVRNLQYWIENAWADGFDREGAAELRHKLVGTKKWIGTVELYVAFVSRGIPARLVDFPGSGRGAAAVMEWITNYFSPQNLGKRSANAFDALKGASPVRSTDRMPLILQHAGHSRTVVGVEMNKNGDPNLLIFDPSRRPSKEIRRAALAKHTTLSPLSSPSKKTVDSSSGFQRILSKVTVKEGKRRVSNIVDAEEREINRLIEGVDSSSVSNDAIAIDDDEGEENMQEVLDPNKVVNFFRVNLNKLGRNDRYQILYFPLDPPLDDNERRARRVVMSERVA